MRASRLLLHACLAGIASLAVLAPAASRGVAHAQTAPGKEHAKRLFDEGVELEKKGDYAAALGHFREAEQIMTTLGLRYHKAFCLEMSGKLTAAIDEYESADKMAAELKKPEVHTAVVARLEPLRARAPQIAIRLATKAQGAEVQLDGVAVGAPLLDGRSFRLDPGEHAVTVRAPGYRNFARKVLVPEAITTTVDVVLERATATAPIAPTTAPAPLAPPAAEPEPATATIEPPREPVRSRSLTAPIVTTSGAVALAASGLIFFLVAGGAQSDALAQCPQKASCDSERSKVRTFDALALGSFVGAAGLGVVAVVLWTSKGPERAAATTTGARLFATPTALGLEGRF